MPYFLIRFAGEDKSKCYTTGSNGPIEGKWFNMISEKIQLLVAKHKIRWWGFYLKPMSDHIEDIESLDTKLKKMISET